jgi:hypothetical protein
MNDRDDMAVKRALDGLPRSLEPPEDLWPGVRGRLRRRSERGWHWPESFEPRTIRIAAGIGLIGIGLTTLATVSRLDAHWHAAGTRGTPLLAGQALRTEQHMLPGTELVTDHASRARLMVGSIGVVDVDVDTRVRLIAARAGEHRLALERGLIRARIDAPPRLFIVETPSGTAVDLGCAYTLHVDSLGNSVIHVTAGWVAFSDRGREALVPGGFLVMARREGGIGTPVAEDAPGPVLRAAAVLDAGVMPDSALALLLRSARRQDAVTLLHLLPRVGPERRAAIYDRLAALAPPPEGVTREGALRGDELMLRLWWEQLPGTLPITPGWVKRIWMVWLRAASWL